ncbi:transposable element Tcb1 transposase [Trichonephila clavipes]|nr:transposable element Tcb1 transposase [Trichonephila clavipes]
MVWGVIAYNTWSPLVLIRSSMQPSGKSMASCKYMCCHSCVTASSSHFSTIQCSASLSKGVTRLSPDCYHPFLGFPIPRYASNRVYLKSFGMVSRAFHEFEGTTGKTTINMERNVSRHLTELLCFNARSYPIVHLC